MSLASRTEYVSNKLELKCIFSNIIQKFRHVTANTETVEVNVTNQSFIADNRTARVV